MFRRVFFAQRETQFSATDAGLLVVLRRNCSIHERIERAGSTRAVRVRLRLGKQMQS